MLRTLGFSVTEPCQVGVAVGLTGDFRESPSTALEGQTLYRLAPAAPIDPYIGLHAGFAANVLTASPTILEILGPQAGVKLRWSERLLLIADLRYSMQAAQPDRGTLLLSIGFGLFEAPEPPSAEPPETEAGPQPPLPPPSED